jgi:5'-nucleotidase / UDP-sugar diphosphatase
MNKHRTIVIAFLLAVLAMPLGAQQAQYLTILHLNDTHSNLLAGTPRDAALAGQRGGIARAATVIGQTAAGDNPWMLLHAGDASVGDLMHLFPAGDPNQPRIPDLEILASLGLTAMTAGNHEFDFSSGGLLAALENSLGATPAFPLLSANIDIPSGQGLDDLADYIQPSVIKTYPGFTVGIIGLTTPMTNYLSDAWPVTFEEDETALGGILYATAAGLRDAGCNYVILLSHMGMKADKALAAAVPGIDLIIGGHDHIATKHPVRVTNPLGMVVPIVQTEGFYYQIGRIELKLHNGAISINKYELIDLDRKVAEEPTIKAAVDGIAAGIEYYLENVANAPFPFMFSVPVANCTQTQSELALNLGRPGHHDTHVGNLVADAYQNSLGVDIGLIPGGSTAQALFPGPVTGNDIFRMIGYGANEYDGPGFEVVTFALSGYDLWVGLETTLGDIESDDELFMQVSSNLKYYYDPSKPAGARLQAVYFNGLPIDPSAIYTIGTNWMVKQYLDMLNAMYSLGMTVLDYDEAGFGEFGLVLDYVANLQVLGGHLTPGRIVAVAPMTAKNNTSPPPMVKIVSTGPNPFTDNSTVVVEAAEAAPLQVKVYDIMGREVAVLADGYVQAGMHSAVFEANALPAGMYFCRLFMIDGSVQTVKMLKAR